MHSIREPVADFVERQELATLRAAFGEGSVIIAGIQGAGGAGKSEVARRFAREIQARYPDAQIEIDLQGMSAQPLSPHRAMERIIRAFHPMATLPEDLAELGGLYVSVLKGKRAVLLLDNARDKVQAEPLLPPPSCAVIVTSREHFVLPNMQVTELGKLAVDDARTLALKIADNRSGFAENADAFLDACGYLALAIRVAVTTVVEKPILSVEEHLRRLKENRLKNLAPVAAALQASYELLTPEQQRALRLLAIFPSDFTRPAADAICHSEDNEASAEADPTELLSALHSSSLLEYTAVTRRFRLHDLTREFAQGKLRECDATAAQPEEPSARRLHADHYLQGLSAADRVYTEGGKHIRPALDWFDLERVNIEAGFSWAVEQSANDEVAAELVLNYPLCGAHLLSLRQNPRQQISWFENALKVAPRIGAQRGEYLSLAYLGNAHVGLGEVSKGIEFLQQSLEFARKHRHRHDEATSMGNLGVAYLELGEPRKAIGYNRRHLALACEIGDQGGQSKALSNLGCAYDARGEPCRAIKYFEKSLAIDSQMGDRANEGKVLGNLGVVHERLGHAEEAVDYHRRQLAIACEIGDRAVQGQALFNLARPLMQLGQGDEAFARAEAALKIFEDIESPLAEAVRQKLAEWRGVS